VLGAAACLYPALLSVVAGSVRRLIGLGACLQGGLVISALVGSGRGSDLRPSGGVIAFSLACGLRAAIQASFQAVARMEEDGIGGDLAGVRGLARRSRWPRAPLLGWPAGRPAALAGFLVRILVASSAVAGGYAWVAVAGVAASAIYAIAVLRWIGRVRRG